MTDLEFHNALIYAVNRAQAKHKGDHSQIAFDVTKAILELSKGYLGLASVDDLSHDDYLKLPLSIKTTTNDVFCLDTQILPCTFRLRISLCDFNFTWRLLRHRKIERPHLLLT